MSFYLQSNSALSSAGTVCMLKTGIKDGPNKGKSFYVCVDNQGCDFTQQARYKWTKISHNEPLC